MLSVVDQAEPTDQDRNCLEEEKDDKRKGNNAGQDEEYACGNGDDVFSSCFCLFLLLGIRGKDYL